MAGRTPRDVEQALYSTEEFSRLQDSVGGDSDTADVVFELVRCGAVIADYAVRSAAQRVEFDSAVLFGFFVRELWRGSVPEVGAGESVAVAWLAHAVATVAAFSALTEDPVKGIGVAADKESTYADGAGRGTGLEGDALADGASGLLDQLLGDGPGRIEIEHARLVSSRVGYVPAVQAARANRPWDALDALLAVAANRALLPDTLFASGPGPLAALDLISAGEGTDAGGGPGGEVAPASVSEPAWDAFVAAAKSWRGRLAPRGASLEHAKGRPTDAFGEPSSKDSAFLLAATTGTTPWGVSFRVWFGTDRRPAEGGRVRFLNERDPDGNLHLGVCLVNIPETHQFATTGPGWFRKWTRWGVGDRVSVDRVHRFADEGEFTASIREALNDGDSDNAALVFVHGFANTFDAAAIRAAQLGCDLKVRGVTAMFSWPSYGSVMRYHRDGLRVEQAEDNFVDFIELLATRSGVEKVDIITHSMGGRLLSRTISRIDARLRGHGARLGTVVLAAPDVDVTVFGGLSGGFGGGCKKASIYVSANDRALLTSRRYWGEPRVGLTPPVTVTAGIDTIDAGDIDFSALGHGYYAESRGVLLDIHALMNGAWNPARRPQLVARHGSQGSWWAIS